jgi:hypothetical protein
LAAGDILNLAARSGVGLGNGGKGHGEPVRVDDVSSETHASDPTCDAHNIVGLIVLPFFSTDIQFFLTTHPNPRLLHSVSRYLLVQQPTQAIQRLKETPTTI